MLTKRQCFLTLVLFLSFSELLQSGSQSIPADWDASVEPYLGRWDVTVKTDAEEYPSWFEILKFGLHLEGRFVGKTGSARPIQEVDVENGELKFSLRPQYENRRDNLVFKGRLEGQKLFGTTTNEAGKTLYWTAVRAPSLRRAADPIWGNPIELFNGKNLNGWKLRHPEKANGWKVENGVLVNHPPSVDLLSEQTFEDFKLHVELMVPEKGNSGVYLRGRHEIQVEDSYGMEPESHVMGGVYGFLTPTSNAYKKAGEWQTLDITLIGRIVTVVLNGAIVLKDLEIPGITGGALDSNEGAPGPLFLQGDHSGVSYRKVVVWPAKK